MNNRDYFPRKMNFAIICKLESLRIKIRSELQMNSEYTVFEYSSAELFLGTRKNQEFHFIIIENNLCHMSGLDLIQKLKLFENSINSILLLNLDSSDSILNAIKLGIRGILDISELARISDCLEELHNGKAYFSPLISLNLVNEITNCSLQSKLESLTDRELQILKLISEVKKDKGIADLLKISQNTVRFHIKNIKSKLNAKNKMELLRQTVTVDSSRKYENTT